MKNNVKLFGIASIYAIGALMMSSCGSAEENHEHSDSMENHEHTTDEAHDHDAEGMEDHANMDMSEGMKVMDCPKWENGAHQHTTYVCPMWEEEGEMEEAGDCKKCGMALVAFADVKEQHDSQNHQEGDGHDHEGDDNHEH